jgi:hypothetical protein
MGKVIALLRLMRCVIIDLAGAHLPNDDLTTAPVLYMYDLDKNIQFHQDDGLCLADPTEKQCDCRQEEAVYLLYRQRAEICFAQVDDAFIQ